MGHHRRCHAGTDWPPAPATAPAPKGSSLKSSALQRWHPQPRLRSWQSLGGFSGKHFEPRVKSVGWTRPSSSKTFLKISCSFMSLDKDRGALVYCTGWSVLCTMSEGRLYQNEEVSGRGHLARVVPWAPSLPAKDPQLLQLQHAHVGPVQWTEI